MAFFSKIQGAYNTMDENVYLPHQKCNGNHSYEIMNHQTMYVALLMEIQLLPCQLEHRTDFHNILVVRGKGVLYFMKTRWCCSPNVDKSGTWQASV